MSIISVVGSVEVASNIAAKAAQWGAYAEGVVARVVNDCADEARANTPVETGTLQNGFGVTVNKLDGTIINDVDYAAFVELGHHTRGGGSFVPGQYMLTNAFLKYRDEYVAELQRLASL